MIRDELFEKFIRTGKIEDYLRYKNKLKENGEDSGTGTRSSTKNN